MNTAFILLADQQQGGGYSFMIMILLMIVIFYFFMIRPQRKQQKKLEDFRNSLTVGSEVILSGGIYGKVKSLNAGETYLSVEIAKDVVIKVDRNFIYAKDNQPVQQ